MFTKFARKTAIGTMAAFATLVTVAAAAPASAEAPRSIMVGFADLDLSTSDGAAMLDRRLVRAATTVCGNRQAQTLAEHTAASACRNTALAAVAPKVDLALAKARDGRAYAANSVSVRAAR